MLKNLKIFIIIGIIMAILDYIYLNSISSFFKKAIYKIQKSPLVFKYVPAILCYFFLILSLFYFIISKNGNLLDAFILGVCIYGVFELTNYATISKWPLKLVIIDTLWGGILFSLTTFIYLKFFKIKN
uniref:DUF2177 domain containing protein n=1 Tax=Nucleocytoviricota sp. TaxID=2809609 RepID=A0A9E8JWS4_9VIRU|nr:DUF2177 domain containing protein [Nucleocytoviricota sp.]UZT29070.1 DUF2177 domain containing protein [Nucleocytoviricota sp.]